MINKKEWLKNLKPLEALNQLKNIPIYETSMYGDKYYYEGRLYDIYIYKRMVNIIKYALENYEKLKSQDKNNKKLKALEIINKKHVNVAYLNQAFLWNDDNKKGCDDYNCHWGIDDDGYHTHDLAQEEYDLLKEILL